MRVKLIPSLQQIDEQVVAELKMLVREKIAPFAMPDFIQV